MGHAKEALGQFLRRRDAPKVPFIVSNKKSEKTDGKLIFPIKDAEGNQTGYSIQIDCTVATLRDEKDNQVQSRYYGRDKLDPKYIRSYVTHDLEKNGEGNPVFGPDYRIIVDSDDRLDNVDAAISGESVYNAEVPPLAKRTWDTIRSWQGKQNPGMVRAYKIIDTNWKHEETGYGLVVKGRGTNTEGTEIVIVDMKTGKPVDSSAVAFTPVTRKQNTHSIIAYAAARIAIEIDAEGKPKWLAPNTGTYSNVVGTNLQ